MIINDNIKYLIHLMYDNFKKYFDTGDMIFTGSIVYDKIDLYHKEETKDVDISIISGHKGDQIMNEIKNFFLKNDFDFRLKYYVRDWEDGLRGMCLTQYGLIDFLRNTHNNKQNESIVEILPSIYTKYYGHEYIINIIYNCYMYNKKENKVNQYKKFYDMLIHMYNNKKEYIKNKELDVKIKFLIDPMSLTKKEKEIYMISIKNLNFLFELMYNNFKKYFDTGDMIFTGSIVYNKIGLLNKTKEIKDVDISIISGHKGDQIVTEINNFFNSIQDFKVKYIEYTDYILFGLCMTEFGVIDIFRNDHNNKEKESTIEILPDIYTKYYGDEWIMKVIYDNTLFLEKEIKNGKSEHNEIQLNKFNRMLKEMHKNTNIEFEDKIFESKLKILK
jgi:hypothetical protein